MQEGDLGSLLRNLIRQEIQNLTGAQPWGQPKPMAGAQPWQQPPNLAGNQPNQPWQAPVPAGTGGAPAPPWTAAALSPAQAMARAHMELTESMRQNLQKLKAVLRETEALAQQMEQFLSYQSRQPWQREAGAPQQGPDGQGPLGQAQAGQPGGQPEQAGQGGQGWEGTPQGWGAAPQQGEQGGRRQAAGRTRRLWRA